MSTNFRKLGLLAALTLGTALFAGCSCVQNDCAPPPPPPPKPRPAPTVCNPCALVPAPVATVAAVQAPAPVCSTNVCRIVPPGTTIYSDPPTVTVSANGQVINQTPVAYYPAGSAGTVSAQNPQATAVSTNNVPRSSNVRNI